MSSDSVVAAPELEIPVTRRSSRRLSWLGIAYGWKHIIPDLRTLVKPAPGNIPGLDLARAAAVLLVICDHFAYGWRDAGFANVGFLSLPNFRWGWTGVDLFFVLSGCLIGQQLWREYAKSGTVDVLRFVGKRGFRIWPLYFTTLIVLAIRNGFFAPVWADWTLVSNYVTGRGYVRGWSLSTEEHFYILTPLVFLAVGRFRSARFIALAFATGLLSVPILRWFTASALRATGMPDLVISDAMYSPFHLHSEALFLGLLIAFVKTRKSPGTPVATWPVFLTLLVAAGAGLVMRSFDKISFAYVAMAFCYGSLVWFLWNAPAFINRIGQLGITHMIARLSFGMYLNHLVSPGEIPRARAAIATLTDASAMQALVALALVIASSMLIATVSYVLVEQPFLRLRAAVFRHERGLTGHALSA